ncbi:65-kDa microtubule-associated protein 3-like [Curcuma longa]|uniref:65-kDa microtubule-associated protein 3-like n=1 Tax=Curcuma longa TaxID=136217 RepID=UPI003D9E43B1
MAPNPNCRSTRIDTAHETLLDELQIIWDEVGESEGEKDKMMLELEQECRNLYRRKIDEANQYRAQIRLAIAGLEAEIEDICCSMGETTSPWNRGLSSAGSLKEQLNAITLKLEEMQIQKNERLEKFMEVMDQIREILAEFSPIERNDSKFSVDESDLSTRALQELEKQLQALQEEKSERLRRVMEHLNTLKALCAVLGLSFEEATRDLHCNSHHDEGYMSISDDSVECLVSAIEHLRKVKLERMQKNCNMFYGI